MTPRATLRTLSGVLAGALLLTSCGAVNERSLGADDARFTGVLAGAGASSQQAAMQGWTAGYSGIRPGVTVDYDPIGSGGGRKQFLAGGIDFAGTDSALDEKEAAAAEDRCGNAGVLSLPNYIAPIAVVYHLEGVEGLNLSPATVAGIFAQQITTWNDPAVVTDNPGATLPADPITPVHRSDESGTTANFTDYLSAVAPGAWPHEPSGGWPVRGGEAAQGTSGVIRAVGAAHGGIGYADLSQAGDLGVANIGVGGAFVAPTPEAAVAAVENSEPAGGHDLAVQIDRRTTAAGEYPIVLVSYHLACVRYEDPATAGLVKDFLTYVISEEGQAAAAETAGSAPISPGLRERARSAIDAITAALA